jgi:hypothetical protein
MKQRIPALWLPALFLCATAAAENPLFEHVFTADPAALVDGDTVWLYTVAQSASTTCTTTTAARRSAWS